MRRVIFIACLLAAGAAGADVSIVSGPNQMTIRTASEIGNADLVLDSVDQAFAVSWWYRSPTMNGEAPLPAPDLESANGNEAVLTWNNIDSELTITWTLTLTGGTTQAVRVDSALVVEGLTNSQDFYQLFLYVDLDAGGTAAGDAAEVSQIFGNAIEIRDGSNFSMLVFDAFGDSNVGVLDFQVGAFPTIRDLLSDLVDTTLDGSGLPFSGDFTAAQQYDFFVPAGGSAEVRSFIASTTEDVALPACSDMTTTDLVLNRATTGAELEIGFLDPLAGGIGSAIQLDLTAPAGILSVQAQLGSAFQEAFSPPPGPLTFNFDTTNDLAPDPQDFSPVVNVSFTNDLFPGTNTIAFGEPCRVTLRYEEPLCEVLFLPGSLLPGQPQNVSVVARNAFSAFSPQLGQLNSSAANFPGPINLVSPNVVLANLIGFDPAYVIPSFGPGDEGGYTVTMTGAGLVPAECSVNTENIFIDGLEARFF